MTIEGAAGLSPAAGWAAVFVGTLLSLACRMPTQRVPLHLEPRSLSVFVDGEEVPGVPAELVLRSDRAHVLFFRREGYQPQRLVLKTGEREGEPYLLPSEVHIRLAPTVPRDRELVIEPAPP